MYICTIIHFVCQENSTEKNDGKMRPLATFEYLSKLNQDESYFNTSRKHRNAMHLARTFALKNDRTFCFT